MTHTRFCCLVNRVLASGKELPSSKGTVADPLPKHLLFGLVVGVWLVELSGATVYKFLKEDIGDPSWI